LSYLDIELAAGANNAESSLLLEQKASAFKLKYKTSLYLGRVNYLLGLSLVSGKKIEEGKKVFNEIIDDKNVPDYIKELAKSELSQIIIREKTI